MISDLVQENETLTVENEKLKRKLVDFNKDKIGFNEHGFDYDNLIKLQGIVNDMLDSIDEDEIIDDRTDTFVVSLSAFSDACNEFASQVLDWD